MMKKFLTVFLLLLTASSFRADERVQCMMQDEEWIYQQDPQAVGVKSCKCKCYRCLRVGTLTVTGSATLAEASVDVLNVTTLNVINEDISGNVAIGGNLSVAGNTALHGNLAVDGNSAIAGNETVGGTLGVTGNISTNASVIINGVTLSSTLLTNLLAQLVYGMFYHEGQAAVPDTQPVPFATAGPQSVVTPIANAGGVFTVPAPGDYEVNWTFTPIEISLTPQLQVFVNNGPVTDAVSFSTVTLVEQSGSVIVNVPAGALTIELRNVTGGGTDITPGANSIPSINIRRLS